MPLLLFLLAACADPPVLEVGEVGDAARAGVVALEIAVEPAAVGVVVFVDGTPLGGPIDTTQLADGMHEISVVADGGWLGGGSTRWTGALLTDNTGPAVEVAKRSWSAAQGDVLPVWVRTDESAEVTVRFLGEERALYPVGEQTWRALVGIGIRQEPGVTPLEITARDVVGNETRLSMDVELHPFAWEEGGKLHGLRVERPETEAIRQMREERDAAYVHVEAEQLWEGAMLWPARGAQSSAYGRLRTYPDGERSHHDAVDISAKRRSPVVAANAGVVLVATRQPIMGNAVIVHHGQGVTTSYNHLQRIDVSVGGLVAAGDPLGTVGSTGQSTGPHLHWGMVVDGVAVDAARWPADGFATAGPFVRVP